MDTSNIATSGRTKGERGYTLLFAVIAAALVLGIAAFILNISRKQFELSVAARNSIYSFYAADSGIECVVDANGWSSAFSSTTGGTLSCGGNTVTLSPVSSPSISPSGVVVNDPANPGNVVRQDAGYVSLRYDDGSTVEKQCAKIIITTGWDPSGNAPLTIIDSRGYNQCVTSPSVAPDTSNSEIVERALRLYQSGVW